ncbi:P-loop containing nucleoside triphosphate hydrolase protein [Macrophomina phaseolina]|uniref:Origin recognition complex subunit 1 n=1 Tax=Macrophomina phaseolina TaxID=35725 RepID=A0ABQ8FXR5_9PEZI|nr:P-loop containing nucleoside triphosphate hydrolase protein [Macrophomina phaseolina]
MAPARKQTRTERARQWLKGGGVLREDSDDELGIEDHPWEWIYDGQNDSNNQDYDGDEATPPKRGGGARAKKPRALKRSIIGARMGNFECRLGDTVLLKAEGNEAWVGIVCDLFDGRDDDADEAEKMANFMWFSTPKEIRNKARRRTDYLDNELYITAYFDENPLATINGRATVVSMETFLKKYPSGKVPRTARDYGKIFVCQRGVNTRTATYTEPFRWEDVYSGEKDLQSLLELVKSHTKETRKRREPKTTKQDMDEFVADDDDDHVPQTPKKRRKLNNATTPTSKRKDLTPRKFITPSHKRIVVKKPLEFTPLGTRVLSPSVISSPYQVARNQLHVSSVPATLPCREEEFSTVYSHLEAAITDGSGSCIYISGTPGTGKTATVREVVSQLNAAVQDEELDDFIFVEINGMKVTDPHQSYSLLWEALRGDRVSPAHALELLEREFSSPSPRRVPCVVLMDELDQLVTKNQSVMYNFFNWPGLRHSRLIVLAVANTMDLPERTLSNKISSRLGLTRITFPGYTHDQLMSIIQSRLAHVPGNIVHPDAIQFASRKVAAVSGDARRVLDICRRAVEIAEQQAAAASTTTIDSAPNTPSKTPGRTAAAVQQQSKSTNPTVTIATIKHAIAEATSSPLQQALRALPLASKLFLAALLARLRRSGVQEALLGDVLDEARNLALMSEGSDSMQGTLLGQGPKNTAAGDADEELVDGLVSGLGVSSQQQSVAPRRGRPKAAASGAGAQERAKAARVMGMGNAAVELMEAGIVGLEARRGERVGRVRLGVSDEEVRLAFRDDEEVRGLGFG